MARGSGTRVYNRGAGQQTVGSTAVAGGARIQSATIGGQNANVMLPAAHIGALCLYHHGGGETETAIQYSGDKAGIFAALIAAGWIVAGSAAHGQSFTTQTPLDDYSALYGYVNTNWPCPKVVHLGQSLGGLTALNMIAQRTVPSVGFCGIYPCTTTYNGFVTTPGFDPNTNTASLYAGIPARFYASPDDTTVPKATNSDVMSGRLSGSGAENTVVVCSGAHGDASHFQPSDVLAFMSRCVA
jgi:hypothetical protein